MNYRHSAFGYSGFYVERRRQLPDSSIQHACCLCCLYVLPQQHCLEGVTQVSLSVPRCIANVLPLNPVVIIY
jgi:hypothetical protein